MLVCEKEIKNILTELQIKEYYVDIDMNGAISVCISPQYQQKIDGIYSKFNDIDVNRTTDDIYKLNQILYPVKRIIVDEDEDEDTLERFVTQDFKHARYSQQLNSWVNSENLKKDSRVPRVAFYSYKGGVGRSTTLAIVARILAKEGFKVAVLDLDLEAPGLNSLLLTKPKPSPFGVVDYLYHMPWTNERIDQKRFMSQYVVKEDVPRRNKKPGQIIVMSAGGTVVGENEGQLSLLFDDDEVDIKLESNYLNKLSYIDFDVYSRQATNIFEILLDDMAVHTGADIILFDARTGFSNVSGSLLNQFSDVLSIHIQNNHQNKEGIEFITKHIHKDKLKNTIWSNTKHAVPTTEERNYKSTKILKEFIESKLKCDQDEFSTISYFDLPFVRSLDNINAHRLKDIIEIDRPFMNPYVELAEQIMHMVALDKKLPNYISEQDRTTIINDLHSIIKTDIKVTYISQRFLGEDLELFVGFPGSGKQTFRDYMKKERDLDVSVISFDNFNNLDASAHRILSHVVFLDWNIEEASQAVCKWILQSDKFFKWLVENPQLNDLVNPEELKLMLSTAEYELDPKISSEILDLVFQYNNNGRPLGWRYIFSLLQYREGYVLPYDIMSGVKDYINYFIEKQDTGVNKTSGVRAVFPSIPNHQIYKEIWREVGLRKLQWLSTFDNDLLKLIYAIRESTPEIRGIAGERKSVEESKFIISKKLVHINETEFELLFEKALGMEIIRKKYLKDYQLIMLSPVYQLIEE